MNQKIIEIFIEDTCQFDINKQFDFLESLNDEGDVLEYLEVLLYLLNNVYLSDGVDSEIESLIETVKPEILVKEIIKSFDSMDRIDPIFDWEKFLFDNDSFSFTLEYAKMMKNKNSFEVYLENLLKDSVEFIKYDNVKKRVENMNFVKQKLVLK